MRRTRYQLGCLHREVRKRGPATWVFRFRDTEPGGKRVNRKIIIGTVANYRTKSAALNAVNSLRFTINQAYGSAYRMTVNDLVNHYRREELAADNYDEKAFSTKDTYNGYLRKWILPRWATCRLSDVKTVAVQEWLAQVPLAAGSRAKIRNIMSAVFNHAIRYEWLGKNPITLVRQSSKRQRIPVVLQPHEVQALLEALPQRERMLVLLDFSTGLRMGELLALKWADVNFEGLELNVTRSVVKQVVGTCKTEASQKPIPLDEYVASELLAWKNSSAYNRGEDWVFASPHTKGAQPYWAQTLMRCFIRPTASRVGINKRIGWHTFRHTFSTLLKANGEDVKVVQELMRHASCKLTLDTYTQAVTPAKRKAQSKVVNLVRINASPAERPSTMTT
jgi:integrase